jgi:16S rRNA (uracil1498-N3)-methyltransferase
MKHRFRFFLANPPLTELSQGSLCTLSGSEHQHLSQVLRLEVGSLVDLCDGKGSVGSAEIIAVQGKQTELTLRSVATFPPPSAPLIAAVGALKPGFIDELLPSLTELGCDEVHIYLQSNTAKTRIHDKALQRWQSIALAASKQCKRPYFPQLFTWPSLAAFVEHSMGQTWEQIYVQPEVSQGLSELPTAPRKGRCFVVGGEKGLDPAEEAFLTQKGFLSAHLGPLILRAYTATLASAAILASKRW